jgi:hypothetical protein
MKAAGFGITVAFVALATPSAVRVLRSIGDDPTRGTDPWWHYRMGAGYKADPLWRETLAMMEAR